VCYTCPTSENNEKEEKMETKVNITEWMQDKVDAVKAHAMEHYDEDGWSVIVECYDDEMIEEMLRKAPGRGTVRTRQGAIDRVWDVAVSIYADRMADARNSAF
jgi:hypothetical protein